MKPLRFRASNYHDYETLDVTFPDGPFAIVGPNGSGKSSVPRGVNLCLFDAMSRSLAEELPRSNPTADLMIETTFEHDDSLYRVRRGYSAGGRGKASCDFEKCVSDTSHESEASGTVRTRVWDPLTLATIKETNAEIVRTIGMNRAMYENSVHLAQGARSIADPSIKPQARRELFFGALALDRKWTPYMVKARAKLRECEAQRQELSGRVGTLEETIAGKAGAESCAVLTHAKSATADFDVTGAEKTVEAAQAKVTDAEKDESRRREYAARLKSAEQTWQALEEIDGLANVSQVQLAELEPMIAEKQLATKDIAPLAAGVTRLEEERETLTSALRAAETTLREQHERLARIEQRHAQIVALTAEAGAAESAAGRVGTGEVKTCQTCGQEIADAAAEKVRQGYIDEVAGAMAKAEALTSENAADMAQQADPLNAEAELGDIQARIEEGANQIKATRAALENAQAAEVSLATLTAQAASYRGHIAKAQAPGHAEAKRDAEVELRAAQVELANVSGEVAVDLAALKRSAESAAYSLNVAQTAARTAHGEVVRAEAELERIAQAEAQLAEHAKDRDKLLSDHDLYSQMERACGKTGVPLWIVENVAIPSVEEETERALKEFGAPYRVEYRTLRETKDGELADALDIIVITDDGEGPLESFSGGEASRIIPAIQRGFAYFLRESCGVDAPTLFMDELAYLDEAGRVAYVDYLRGLIDSGQYQSIGVISHDPEVRDAFDQVIEIRKDGNRSEVVA